MDLWVLPLHSWIFGPQDAGIPHARSLPSFDARIAAGINRDGFWAGKGPRQTGCQMNVCVWGAVLVCIIVSFDVLYTVNYHFCVWVRSDGKIVGIVIVILGKTERSEHSLEPQTSVWINGEMINSTSKTNHCEHFCLLLKLHNELAGV